MRGLVQRPNPVCPGCREPWQECKCREKEAKQKFDSMTRAYQDTIPEPIRAAMKGIIPDSLLGQGRIIGNVHEEVRE